MSSTLPQKRISLPSGAQVTVGPLSPRTYLRAYGTIPDAIKPQPDKPDLPPPLEELQKISCLILTRCTKDFNLEGKNYRLVDKDLADCAASELSLDALDQADADAIAAAVTELSPMLANAPANPFPEDGNTTEPRPHGPPLQPPPA